MSHNRENPLPQDTVSPDPSLEGNIESQNIAVAKTVEDWYENKERFLQDHILLGLSDLGFPAEEAKRVSTDLFQSANEEWNSMTANVPIPREFRDEESGE
ncbi:MAG TPA: hypothetical protein PLD54_04230 [Candidatus Levybacteria bacterium]|mgnify:CR=1 FL=1|nr:hypothetical protein [Candidatus Levybacteria bacterium]